MSTANTKSASQYGQAVRFFVLHGFPNRTREQRWQDFLARVDCPGAYHTPAYFLEPYWEGKHPFAVLAFKQGAIVGVLTGLHLRDRVISGLPSRPQVSIEDQSSSSVMDTLRTGLLWEAGSTRLVEVFSWHSTPLPAFEENGFRERQLEGDVVLDLAVGAEALFKQFHENRKRNIRTAIRNGVEVCEEKSAQDLAEYWEVYRHWQDTVRKHVHADCKFDDAQKVLELSANHRRFLARYQGQAIAATSVRFCAGGLIEYAGNCSLDRFNSLRPNDLLLWRTIEWACQRGFRKYSLGAAHPFLQKSGGMIEPIDCYRMDRTFFHRYQLKESVLALRRALLHALPVRMQPVARAWLKRLLG
ncbi:MAG: GNAT family N-acetyltransferase [Terriglobales bacterium]